MVWDFISQYGVSGILIYHSFQETKPFIHLNERFPYIKLMEIIKKGDSVAKWGVEAISPLIVSAKKEKSGGGCLITFFLSIVIRIHKTI